MEIIRVKRNGKFLVSWKNSDKEIFECYFDSDFVGYILVKKNDVIAVLENGMSIHCTTVKVAKEVIEKSVSV